MGLLRRRREVAPSGTRAISAYGQGFTDGVLETLDQLENRSAVAPDGGYRGILPPQLQEWIADARARAEEHRA